MHDFEYVQAHINDVLCITKETFMYHVSKLQEVLTSLRKVGLKVNLKKSFISKIFVIGSHAVVLAH